MVFPGYFKAICIINQAEAWSGLITAQSFWHGGWVLLTISLASRGSLGEDDSMLKACYRWGTSDTKASYFSFFYGSKTKIQNRMKKCMLEDEYFPKSLGIRNATVMTVVVPIPTLDLNSWWSLHFSTYQMPATPSRTHLSISFEAFLVRLWAPGEAWLSFSSFYPANWHWAWHAKGVCQMNNFSPGILHFEIALVFPCSSNPMSTGFQNDSPRKLV